MYRRIVALLLAGCVFSSATSALAAEAPELLARTSGSVSITRSGDENAVKEIAQSVYWGAAAGAILGGAIMLADSGPSAEPLRWGIVLGAFGGLGAGIYFVANRPQPTSLLELRQGQLVPNTAPMAALEPVPGGVRVYAVSLRY